MTHFAKRLLALALLSSLALVVLPHDAAAGPISVLGCTLTPVWGRPVYPEAVCLAGGGKGAAVEVAGWAANTALELQETARCDWIGGPFCDLDFVGHMCNDFGLCPP